MRRIAVLGSPGSGKSTLARELGSILGLKVYHMDALYWKPGGVPTTDEERDAILREVIDRERWVFDGNDRRTLDRRLAQPMPWSSSTSPPRSASGAPCGARPWSHGGAEGDQRLEADLERPPADRAEWPCGDGDAGHARRNRWRSRAHTR